MSAAKVGLSDVRPDGRMRLDAMARVLQDAAADDNSAGDGVWILRKLVLDIARTPRFRAELRVRTWCSGIGPRWAERRTDVFVGEVHAIEARALWVYVDPATGAPIPIPQSFAALDVPHVSPRLSHAPPRASATRQAWFVRATDIDVLHHVNNAAYWLPVEEELARRGRPRVHRAEVEFRAGVDEGEQPELALEDRGDGFALWWCAAGTVRASMLVACTP